MYAEDLRFKGSLLVIVVKDRCLGSWKAATKVNNPEQGGPLTQ